MIDHQLKSLKDAPVPPADEAAKARALAAAMAAYEAAPAVAPARSGPRPFVLQHGYKFAAGLAVFAVIGPLVALWPPAPEPTANRSESNAKRSVVTRMRGEAPQSVAAPAILASPPAAAPAASPAPAKTPAAPAAKLAREAAPPVLPATPADTASAPPAQRPAADCGPGRACLTLYAERERTRGQVETGAVAALSDAILAGKLPDRAAVDTLALINAFAFPLAHEARLHPLVIVPSPWSGARIGMTWGAGQLSPTGNAEWQVACGGQPRTVMAPLHRPVVGQFDVSGSTSTERGRVIGLFDLPIGASACTAGVQARFSAPRGSTINDNAAPAELYDTLAVAPEDIRFAIAVARFADLLRGTAENARAFGFGETVALADGARGADPSGERAAFIDVMRKAQALAAK